MRFALRYLLPFFLLFISWTAFSQNTNWDTALDMYEDICEQCLDLREQSQAGKSVSVTSLRNLLSQLSSLRSSLMNSVGEMSTLQRIRFEYIRLRYADAIGEDIETSRTELPAVALSSIEPIPSAYVQYPKIDTLKLIDKTENIIIPGERKNPHFALLLYASMPVSSPGIVARLDFEKVGIYAKGSLRSVSDYSYECNTDGKYLDGGNIWTTGNESYGAFALSAGVSYAAIDIDSPLSFVLRPYAGLGCSRKTVLWEDMSGEWAKVKDLSELGLSLDAGCFIDLGNISFMAGISTFPLSASSSISDFRAEFGLGIVF